MMTKVYVILLLCVVLVGTFFYGRNVGVSKCEMQNLQNQINTTEQNQVKERDLNDKVFKTGVVDIRRILRDKYSIAE
jgi:hypothetical protein